MRAIAPTASQVLTDPCDVAAGAPFASVETEPLGVGPRSCHRPAPLSFVPVDRRANVEVTQYCHVLALARGGIGMFLGVILVPLLLDERCDEVQVGGA